MAKNPTPPKSPNPASTGLSSPKPPKSPRLAPPPLKISIETSQIDDKNAIIKREAILLLEKNPEIGLYFLAPALHDEYKESADKMSILHNLGKRNVEKEILMLHAALEKIKSLGEMPAEISPKEGGGINIGFTISTAQNKRYFVKSFLDSSSSGKKNIHEYFVYSLLQHLGYGAKIEFACYKNIAPTLISQDLSIETKDTKKSFTTLSQEQYEGFNQNAEQHIMALELLARLLDLSDLQNPANSGFVRSLGPKTQSTEGKIKPKIIDFHFDITAGDHNRGLHYEDIEKDLAKDLPETAMPFSNKISQERLLTSYFEALNRLINGHKPRPSIEEALALALEDCKIICAQMQKGIEEDEFTIEAKNESKTFSPLSKLHAMSLLDESLDGYVKNIARKIDVLKEIFEKNRPEISGALLEK